RGLWPPARHASSTPPPAPHMPSSQCCRRDRSSRWGRSPGGLPVASFRNSPRNRSARGGPSAKNAQRNRKPRNPMTSRDAILRRLRAVKLPYADEPPPAEYLPVVPLDASDRAALIDRFVTKAEALSSVVHRCASEEQARATVLDIIS